MSFIKKRNVHPPKFKAKIALEAICGAKTINEIAQDYGVHLVTLSLWKKEMQDHAKSIFEGKRDPVPVATHSATERLYGEIDRLKMEVDWLKKSQSFLRRDKTGLDWPRSMVVNGSSVCIGWCISFNGIRQTNSKFGSRGRGRNQEFD
jgi:transposase-like protein